ncbi:hypothetical protein BD626DRAFT_111278 [Schizophyllum amplum]|uniref:Secreted protein n=1 Tax=Schizophyllum amplum TaxID=97359 RepID=A0A550CTI7_9AGAR|nr:hypothetical protein BD626DRAFT_111278 [Auriculariopsis ampla]
MRLLFCIFLFGLRAPQITILTFPRTSSSTVRISNSASKLQDCERAGALQGSSWVKPANVCCVRRVSTAGRALYALASNHVTRRASSLRYFSPSPHLTSSPQMSRRRNREPSRSRTHNTGILRFEIQWEHG